MARWQADRSCAARRVHHPVRCVSGRAGFNRPEVARRGGERGRTDRHEQAPWRRVDAPDARDALRSAPKRLSTLSAARKLTALAGDVIILCYPSRLLTFHVTYHDFRPVFWEKHHDIQPLARPDAHRGRAACRLRLRQGRTEEGARRSTRARRPGHARSDRQDRPRRADHRSAGAPGQGQRERRTPGHRRCQRQEHRHRRQEGQVRARSPG